MTLGLIIMNLWIEGMFIISLKPKSSKFENQLGPLNPTINWTSKAQFNAIIDPLGILFSTFSFEVVRMRRKRMEETPSRHTLHELG